MSNKVHYSPPGHTCSLLVKLTPMFGVALLPACSNWCGVEQSEGLMDRPAWLCTKPSLLLARVLMCFLYWHRHRRRARRRGGGGRQGGERGTNGRFRTQTGHQWPFNLARGPAESLIKPRALKTEQTAKPEPEVDIQSLSRSLIPTQPFLSFFNFPSLPLIFWPEERQEKRNTRGSLAQPG